MILATNCNTYNDDPWTLISNMMITVYNIMHNQYHIVSWEVEGCTITIQRCSIENQKGAIAIDFVQQ